MLTTTVWEQAGVPVLWSGLIDQLMADADLTTARRLAAFVGQCAHESAGFTVVEENLNYRAERLCQVFPRAFATLALAEEYAGSPERIASRVYADRLGNGPEASGDGWLFRGRGLIQVTGRANYQQLSDDVFGYGRLTETLAGPEWVATPEGAVQSAVWFWTQRGCNGSADRWDLTMLTRLINGGTNGLTDRVQRCERALAVFKDEL